MDNKDFGNTKLMKARTEIPVTEVNQMIKDRLNEFAEWIVKRGENVSIIDNLGGGSWVEDFLNGEKP